MSNLRGLKFDSEYGMSVDVGRLCVAVTPRSASRNATGLERIGARDRRAASRNLGVIL
jgi:hypothetical protein